eukprot:scaffold157707_cov36-Cyclotella_meneghiniana.AAC.1
MASAKTIKFAVIHHSDGAMATAWSRLWPISAMTGVSDRGEREEGERRRVRRARSQSIFLQRPMPILAFGIAASRF